jgi:hypothetical protein
MVLQWWVPQAAQANKRQQNSIQVAWGEACHTSGGSSLCSRNQLSWCLQVASNSLIMGCRLHHLLQAAAAVAIIAAVSGGLAWSQRIPEPSDLVIPGCIRHTTGLGQPIVALLVLLLLWRVLLTRLTDGGALLCTCQSMAPGWRRCMQTPRLLVA